MRPPSVDTTHTTDGRRTTPMVGSGGLCRGSSRCTKRSLVNRLTPRAMLVIASTALCGGLFAACGDAADDTRDTAAASTLQQTIDATSKFDSARLTASFELVPEDALGLAGPIGVRASGPFAWGAEGELPRFELAIVGSIARQQPHARAISTGTEGFLHIDGRDYEVDDDFIEKLLPGKSGAKTNRGDGLAALGLNPAGWFDDPRSRGKATIGGVETTRITSQLDVNALLDDVAKLVGGASGTGGFLTPKLRKQIVDATKSANVNLWTGSGDKILRQLSAVVVFAFDEENLSPISGLYGGSLTLRVRLDGVNATTVRPRAPKGARPLSDLTGDGGLSALLSGLGAGIMGGTGGGDIGNAFLVCLDSAGGRTAEMVKCASKLAPQPVP